MWCCFDGFRNVLNLMQQYFTCFYDPGPDPQVPQTMNNNYSNFDPETVQPETMNNNYGNFERSDFHVSTLSNIMRRRRRRPNARVKLAMYDWRAAESAVKSYINSEVYGMVSFSEFLRTRRARHVEDQEDWAVHMEEID